MLGACRFVLVALALSAAAVGASLAARADDPFASVKGPRFGAKGDGTGDDAAAIQRAIDSGAGTVLIPDGTYRIGVAITLAPNQCLEGTGRATLLWAGDSGADMVTTPDAGEPAFTRPCIRNLTLDAGGATHLNLLHFRNAGRGRIENLEFHCNKGESNIALYLQAGVGNRTGSAYNTVFNTISDIRGTGCSEGIKLAGYYDYGKKEGAVVTDNWFGGAVDFDNLSSRGPRLVGIDFEQWADTNVFAGRVWLSLYDDDSICVRFGVPSPETRDPSPNAAVYNEQFFSIACDAFHGARQTGVQLNDFVKEIRIDNLFTGAPVDFSRATDPSVSYRIVENGTLQPASNAIRVTEKNTERGTPGVPSVEACGAGGRVAAGSTDARGAIVVGAGSPATCSIRFGKAFAANALGFPVCTTSSNQRLILTPYAVSNGGYAWSASAPLDKGALIFYACEN